jgi:SAM-dependent methyltransferase
MENINYKTMKKIVKEGYETNIYSDFYRKSEELNDFEMVYFKELINNLKDRSSILDLGCGTGIPYDLYLINNGVKLTGIDISEKHISLAKRNIPNGNYIIGDYTKYNFKNNKYDAIILLYSIFHIPKEEHYKIIRKIYNILKKGGYLLITMGVRETNGIEVENNFCGSVKMAWSNYDYTKNMELIKDNNFKILKYDNESDFGSNESHLWILAKKE